jgi:phosphoribosylanthranilate isomerase|tara:strand:+ start:32 stop:649 length:618 start_codon:yes stop_codon:yes gene_type:complete
MKLKVCGLSKPTEVETCVSDKVDYCGFILNFPKSHRHISFDKAKDLTKINKGSSQFVGVLVKPTDQELDKFSKLNLDYFQLYGDYSNSELIKIKEKYGKKLIATVQVKKKEDIDKYKIIDTGSDIILWDSSGYEESISWDYNWIKSVSINIKKMIAGNITIDKLNKLVDLADIIDVSGALETNKVKDINKIKQFTAAVKKISHAN